jgi:hypothetical protein
MTMPTMAVAVGMTRIVLVGTWGMAVEDFRSVNLRRRRESVNDRHKRPGGVAK